MKIIDITVAICTYNGADRLPLVFDCLNQQTNLEGINWEILVVDNNSSDRTANIVTEYSQKWRSDSQIRYVFEGKQGTSYARYRAMKEAASTDLVAFLDDDNLPRQNWLVSAYNFGKNHPQAGAYGANIYAKLDQVPPPDFNQYCLFLAIYQAGNIPFCYQRQAKPRRVFPLPGCVIRKTAWQECVPAQQLLRGRNEKNPDRPSPAGEDLEIMFYIQNSDWELWHNPEMMVDHYIPARRLEKNYLLKIARGSGLGSYALRSAKLYAWQRPFLPLIMPIFFLKDIYRVISYYLKNRAKLSTNISIACELESRIGTLLSPFYRY